MASSHVLPGLTRATVKRAVHLRLVPRIETIAESREILRLIQGFGRVEMFRNLKYDALSTPNTMLVIFETDESAQALLKASPLRFSMRPEEAGERVLDNQDPADGSTGGHVPARHYQLQANLSTMHHRDQINQSAYNGPYRVSTKSAIQEHLVQNVPMAGLSELNLKKEEKPWRVLLWEKEKENTYRRSLRQMLNEGQSSAQTPPSA